MLQHGTNISKSEMWSVFSGTVTYHRMRIIGTGAYFRNKQRQWVLIFVGYLYSWGAYKRMVNYESSNGDLVEAAQQQSPLHSRQKHLRSMYAVTYTSSIRTGDVLYEQAYT